MKKGKISVGELAIIISAVNMLAEICSESEIKIIRLLTGLIWDKDVAKTLIEFKNKED